MSYSKLLVTAMAIAVSFTSVSSATLLVFKLEMNNFPVANFSHIHFKAWGNDFWGLIARDVAEDEFQQIATQGNSNIIDCSQRIRGLYYNAQRGERLWPLDAITAKNLWYAETGFKMEGGLYTTCSGEVGGVTGYNYWIYGHLRHTFNNASYDLRAGVKYDGDVDHNTPQSGSALARTLERFDNKYPLGFIYDGNGGMGFVGCQFTGIAAEETGKWAINTVINGLNAVGVQYFFTGGDNGPTTANPDYANYFDCSNVGIAIDQLLLIKIQGIVGMSSETGGQGVENLGGNEADSKTQYFSTVNVNNATLVNQAKRRAEELCRGRREDNIGNKSNGVICLDLQGTSKGYQISAIGDTTLIARNGTLTLQGMMEPTSKPLDIFIDKGKLIFKRETSIPGPTTDQRKTFNANAFPTQLGDFTAAHGVYLKGNFIINGLIGLTGDRPVEQTPRYFIYGKFTSLNTYAEQLAKNREKQLQNLLCNGAECVTSNDIDLKKIFQRRCDTYVGTGTDYTPCPTETPEGTRIDFYASPLIIVGQDYPSKLL